MSAPGLAHPAEVAEAVVRAAPGPCVAIVEETHEVDVRFARNTVTTDGVRLDRTVSALVLTAAPGTEAAGVARRSGAVDPEALLAEAKAAMTPASDASPLLSDGATPPETGAHEEFSLDPAGTDLGILEAVVGDLGAAFERAQNASRVLSGFARHTVTTTYLASSTGLRRRHAQPTGSLELVGREDGASAWAGAGTVDFQDVQVEELEDQVRRGLGWARRRVEVAPGRHEVVLPPSAVADLMLFVAEAASGRESEDGRTVFSAPGGGTRLGERLSPLPFSLWSDPEEPGLECASFLATGASSADVSVFDNGLPMGRTHWVRDGRLEHLRYHRAAARRSGTEAVGPPDNLVLGLPGAEGTVEDLVAQTERGLLLTCLWYIREVDPRTLLLTGLTRDGVYVIEGGKVVGAAGNFRFNESPVDVLSRATQASSTLRALGREGGIWLNRTAMPALRVPDWNMSTSSKAV